MGESFAVCGMPMRSRLHDDAAIFIACNQAGVQQVCGFTVADRQVHTMTVGTAELDVGLFCVLQDRVRQNRLLEINPSCLRRTRNLLRNGNRGCGGQGNDEDCQFSEVHDLSANIATVLRKSGECPLAVIELDLHFLNTGAKCPMFKLKHAP